MKKITASDYVFGNDARLNNWLWLYLREINPQHAFDGFGADNVRAYLVDLLGYMKVTLAERASNKYLLPKESFKWIGEDERQISWLMLYVQEKLKIGIAPCPPNLFGRNFIIACLDLCEQSLEVKSSVVNRMRIDWNEYIKSDTIFKWFKEKDERSRCEVAWDWLVENRGWKTYGRAPIASYRELLVFFDQLGDSVAEKKLDVAAIKKRWSQKEYRKNIVGKKQYNFVLSDESIAKLDKLAAKSNLSRPQILEALIHFETENSSCLSGKIKKSA